MNADQNEETYVVENQNQANRAKIEVEALVEVITEAERELDRAAASCEQVRNLISPRIEARQAAIAKWEVSRDGAK
ncbi:MAG: hypothetical protein KY432_07395 [Acidobacteria bacterium]|nr:hypothetical protein [Acidobacteriota bacterium]